MQGLVGLTLSGWNAIAGTGPVTSTSLLLLSGDEQSGTDKLLLSGDAQSGTDCLALSGSF